MKLLALFVLLVIAVAYYGYQRFSPEFLNKTEQVREPRLAPDGTLFLVERFSHVTDEGIVTLHPGTEVTIVDRGEGVSKVTDGKQEFDIPTQQLTNDLDIRDQFLQSDRALQTEYHSGLKQLETAALAKIDEDIVALQKRIKTLGQRISELNVNKTRLTRVFEQSAPSPLTGKPTEAQRKQKAEIDQVSANILQLQDEVVSLELFINAKRLKKEK